ncbi:uncharacterized protein LOC141658939 [Silene latifolia]|uniref:uncharacterized protein LOC141658939 n=1 Tax=Silene latifolia TaxID=37657 RepID=UPI003D770126
MDPVKYLFEKPVLNGRLARWTMMLSEFDLKYVPLKVIKGRAVAEFFAENPINDAQTIDTWSFPDEDILQTDVESWDLYFDGASNLRGFGIGVLLISPEGEHTPIAVKLDFEVTNNAAEYEACLIGLQAAVSLGIKNLRVHGDSSLIINQVTGSWKIRSESLAPYQARIDQVAQFFDHVTYLHLPREENQFADALAKLASLINMPDYMMEMPLCIERRSEPAYVHQITDEEEIAQEPWFQAILNFKLNGTYPPEMDKRGQRAIRLLASQYILMQGELYKRTPLGVVLRCLDHSQARKVMEEVHDGECGPHMSGPMMAKKITRLGYYWTTMESDCIKYVRHCHNHKIFGTYNTSLLRCSIQ